MRILSLNFDSLKQGNDIIVDCLFTGCKFVILRSINHNRSIFYVKIIIQNLTN